MNATAFHAKLLGNTSQTPEQFRITSLHQALYDGYDRQDKRGFSVDPDFGESQFLATAVLALALSEGVKPVYIAIPGSQCKWVIDQVEELARHVIRIRKTDKAAIQVMRTAFQQLRITAELWNEAEPSRWVSFGFRPSDPVPDWAQGKLLELGSIREGLQAPRSTEVREKTLLKKPRQGTNSSRPEE